MEPDDIIKIVHRIDELETERSKIDAEIGQLKSKLTGSEVKTKYVKTVERQQGIKQRILEYISANVRISVSGLAQKCYGEVNEVTRNRVHSAISKLKAEHKLLMGTTGNWIVVK